MTIEEEIKNITNSDININKKAVELMKIGQLICNQFNATEYRNAFDGFTAQLKAKIQAVTDTLQKEINQNSDLLSQEDEINKKYALLQEKNNLLQELNKKKTALEATLNIDNDISKLNVLNGNLVKQNIENLQQLNVELANSNTELEKTLTTNVLIAEKNLSAIQKEQLNALEKFDKSQLEKFGEEFSIKVIGLIKDYNEYAEKVNQHRINQEGVIALFKENHCENVNIQEALKSRNEELGNLENLNKEIKDRLERYDNEIKILIEKRDQLPIYQLAETRLYQK